ncbi:MAG TPA: hypothetical protein PLY72_09535 [Candidatus Obscuribacter sp.]|nr:hypothetical protein [Candidatus Obscuribacter sp.]
MLVQFIIVSLLLLNFFLGERGFHLTVTFQRRPVVWSVLTGTLWTVWLYQSCFLLHGQVPALGNGYSCFSYRDSSYIDLALIVGASLVLVCYFLGGCLACRKQATRLSASGQSSPQVVPVVRSRPGQIGFTVRSIVVTILALVCVHSGVALYRNQVMSEKWIKVTGVVHSVKLDSVRDAESGKHNYMTVYTFYRHGDRSCSNSLIFRDDEIPLALKRYSVSSPVVLLCNPEDVQMSVVEDASNIPAQSAALRQFLLSALAVMICVCLLPRRFFRYGSE